MKKLTNLNYSLAIIIARKNSKRIKNKNIKEFYGKPIIYYSIEAAIKSKCFDKIIVSTDCKNISNVAKKFGAEIDFIRPKNLSTNNTKTIEVIRHAINFYKKKKINFKYTSCIYPASPFIKKINLVKGFNLVRSKKIDFVLTVQPFISSIDRAIKVYKNGVVKWKFPKYKNKNSNILKDYYYDAGQFYMGKTFHFFKKNLFNNKTKALKLDKFESVDINEIEDWYFAEKLYNFKKR